MKKQGNTLCYAKMQPQTAVREEYDPLPSFMIRQASKNGVNMITEKTLAGTNSEQWEFYDAPTTFKLYSNSQISKLKTKLKAIMREKQALEA